MKDRYESPLCSRYSSERMQRLFSADTRFSTWRRLWVELADAQRKLGLPITEAQVEELRAHLTDIDYEAVAEREAAVRHDVMAHIYAYGLRCPNAKGIIHLGATSCYVTDNADLVIYRDALRLIRAEIVTVLKDLAAFADRYKALPTPGYTHYQNAQPVTVGKRAAFGCRISCWIWRSSTQYFVRCVFSDAAALPARKQASWSCLTATRQRSMR